MRCVCGYEETIGSKKFIELEELNAKIEHQTNYGHIHLVKVSIYACPECKTLQMY